jgi:hypothetical protein
LTKNVQPSTVQPSAQCPHGAGVVDVDRLDRETAGKSPGQFFQVSRGAPRRCDDEPAAAEPFLDKSEAKPTRRSQN